MLLKKNQVISISGDSKELGIEDYNVRVNTLATVLENQVDNYQKKILVTLNNIDGDSNVCTRVFIKRITPLEKYFDEPINKSMQKIINSKRPDKHIEELAALLEMFFGLNSNNYKLYGPFGMLAHYSIFLKFNDNKLFLLDLICKDDWFYYRDDKFTKKIVRNDTGNTLTELNLMNYTWKPLPKDFEKIIDIVNEQNDEI
jgi:hypothetical protein